MGGRTDGAARKEGAEGGALQASLGSAGISTPTTYQPGHSLNPKAASTRPDQWPPTQLPELEISLSRIPPSLLSQTSGQRLRAALPPPPLHRQRSCPNQVIPSPVGLPRTRKLQNETLGLDMVLPNTFRFAKKESGRKLSILCYNHHLSGCYLKEKKKVKSIPRTGNWHL